jgi:Uma2 family endonuclease
MVSIHPVERPEATMSVTKLYTAEDLMAMGSDAPFELVEGVLQEVSPSGGRSSEIALNIIEVLRPFLRQSKLGYLTGEGAGYVLATDPDTVFAPDVGFVRRDALPHGMPEDFVPCPPDLAVEVMSPSDRYPEMDRKARRYLSCGTRVVWIVRPDDQTVVIHEPGRGAIVLGMTEVIDGGEILPGFRLPVADVFRDALAS